MAVKGTLRKRRETGRMNIPAKIIMYGLLSIFVLTAGHPVQAGSSADLFGTEAIRKNSLRPFPKWTGMLERYFADAGAKPGPCTEMAFNVCHAKRWQELIEQLQGQDLTTQL